MPSHCRLSNKTGSFVVSIWLGNGNAQRVTKVASQHQQTYYYIEAESLYFQPCTVDLVKAFGINQSAQLVEFLPPATKTNPGTPASSWVQPTLIALGSCPPGATQPQSDRRKASIKTVPSNTGAKSENIQAEVDYGIVSPPSRLTPSITVNL
jgi:hypothetical protein